ncbi:DUF4279 domain-containing protein [Micromonospora sp. NIE79]|uniref:DUF4279 domain-containing protein n=1 Tax=Micromonospora trifolii TaxID=2911208 RepID=A0ABS9N5W8_9ACTN|nr:DUF4279 domain-containing protein [Micromonospora trifolii]MCG5445355.1 DUF4279 domain-containing protein [Micromonospora trifolii]
MRTMATFRLRGGGERTAAHVTELLGIQPSDVFEAGTPVGSRSATRHEECGWLLSSAGSPESDAELAEQLGSLLDILEPVADRLWQLVDGGYWANWFCLLGSHAAEHAVELDRDLLHRLLKLPGGLWLDVYGDDEGAEGDG